MREIYRFGPFELDATVLRLYRDGVALEIEPRPLEVLAEILRNAGQVVGKTDLMERVWPERVVTESAITRCINLLRATLNDDSHTLILTVHGYGYRYTGEVLRVEQTGRPQSPLASAGWLPAEGQTVPGRAHWQLTRALDPRASVWLARHEKTDEQRVFKFAYDGERLPALKRELTLHRLLRRALPEHEGCVRLLDCNFEAPPFFLELEYCEHGNLAEWFAAESGAREVPLATRLDLVAQAAESLAAAHAIGVLHLDVKPGNVLVSLAPDGRWRIRWTDFGSAKVLDPSRLDQLNITRLGLTQTHMDPADGTTPLYTAPEVIAGQKPGALSDIYALGVMLYQLVVGDLRRPMAPGWEQEVADELLREDIALAAHGKPERRLPSAAELAARLRDLEPRRAALAAQRAGEAHARALRDQVARARARRPWVVTAVVILTAGLLATLYFQRDALQARDAAREQAALAEAVTNFFNDDILNAASPYQLDHHGDMTVREAVDRAAARLEGRFPQQPAIEAAIRARLATLYIQSAKLPQAGEHLEKAATLFAAARGPNDKDAMNAQYLLAAVLTFTSRFAEAGDLLDRLDAIVAQSPRLRAELPGHTDGLRATYYRQLQRYTQVIPHSERVLQAQMKLSPNEIMPIAMRRYMLAHDYAQVGRFAEAQREFEHVFSALRASEDSTSSFTALANTAYGAALFLEGRHVEAADVLTRAHEVLSKTVGRQDDALAEASGYLCLARVRLGQTAAAANACRESLAIYRERFGEHNHFTLSALGNAGIAELAAGDTREAMEHLETARDGLASLLGLRAPSVQLFSYYLASAHLAAGELGRAESLLAELQLTSLRLTRPQEPWEAHLAALRGRLLPALSRRPRPPAS